MKRTAFLVLGLAGGCVYFNAMYDANREFDAGVRAMQENSGVAARIRFDSVIAKTGRIVEGHPTSKYADDAAILKTRSELFNKRWESAAETAGTAVALADDGRTAALAEGLGAVALRQLGRTREADSLLSRALEADLEADDRALFLFERGLARQQLGRPEQAAEDLEEAAGDLELSPEGRLTLSLALRDMGQTGRSAHLAAPLLEESSLDPASPLYGYVDSLTTLDPLAVDSVAARLLQEPELQVTRAAAYLLLRGVASLRMGDTVQALALFEQVVNSAATSMAAADAAYWTIELQLARADSPDDVAVVTDLFQTAMRSTRGRHGTGGSATRRGQAARSFANLIAAYEERGVSAAEAALWAAEIARVDLGAPAVARGLYLLYVREVPDSRWAAKAIVGALSVSGHRPDPAWVPDDGPGTDDALRQRLTALPGDDPYRLILVNPGSRTPAADSAYVLAEADLGRRLDEIRRQFDVSFVQPTPEAADTAAASRAGAEF